ncbi:MAG: hypothetical protein B7X29_08995 [Halothiobacillus sp. 13-55-115]|jgi:hypothetical protein|nr:MAG: hypothetical protein B7X29_08995 [Halothiobacillus sp. 13-55-115]
MRNKTLYLATLAIALSGCATDWKKNMHDSARQYYDCSVKSSLAMDDGNTNPSDIASTAMTLCSQYRANFANEMPAIWQDSLPATLKNLDDHAHALAMMELLKKRQAKPKSPD